MTSIKKHFFRKPLKFNLTSLLTGLIIWLLSAYIFYALFQLFREALRLFTGYFGDKTLIILSPTENYIYNVFYASIASALGYSFALKFILQTSLYKFNRKARFQIKRTLNIEGFNTWSYLFWIGKMGSLLGVWYLTIAFQYNLNLLEEFPTLLVLLPIVLFYSSWPNFSRVISKNKGWWFISISMIFLITSFTYGTKNFLDYKKNNDKILSQSIPHVYNLQVPKSQSQRRITRKWSVIDMYVVKDTAVASDPAIFFKDINNKIYINQIKNEIADLGFTPPDQPIINLRIDTRIPVGFVKSIIKEIRKAGIYDIQLSTAAENSKYPPDYPDFRYFGIRKVLPRYFPEIEAFLDSAEQIDLSGKRIRINDSYKYRNNLIKQFNRIEIAVSKDSITLNGKKTDKKKLEEIVYKFIKKYSPGYVIIFNSDNNISYRRYINTLDILHSQVDRLRNERSLVQNGRTYESWNMSNEFELIKRQYPIRILEWTEEEQRINDLAE
ncbi:ExbD/TolR family protein [Mangrovivirga cuniculi]|uniref:Uncharacterized protein n=1 Tax=Mangrovivirga cuniculi TaxID=2715131 RepID=A0A4D7JU43_9BACT|nr:hypothetical protein [Mangrovivirga cuniculi]QCK15696.1 hypothetical protein DCC35_13560 [Mangrovivirga cuniculi]